MVHSCMIAMGQAIIQGALHCAQYATVMVGVARNAIVLVGVAREGHHNIAPVVMLGSVVCSWATTATGACRGHVIAKIAQHIEIVQHAVRIQSCLSATAINMGIEYMKCLACCSTSAGIVVHPGKKVYPFLVQLAKGFFILVCSGRAFFC